MFGSLIKSVIAVAVTPVTLAVDVLAMPFDAVDKEELFTRTSKKLEQAADNLNDALD